MLSCLLALLFSNIFVFSNKKAFAEDDGLNFIANCPTQTTEYQRGEGTVTFVPEVNGKASIILNNATIYANQKVTYWSLNYTYAGIAYGGDVDIILEGDNVIYLNNDTSSSGILVYDGNARISGEGSLFVGFDENNTQSRQVCPIQVMGNFDVLNNRVEGNFTDTGNLTIDGGTITLDSKYNLVDACMFAHNKITINGGSVTTKGNSIGISSNYNGIEINGGQVVCQDFTHEGLLARGGDLTISGQDTKVELTCADTATYSEGIRAGEVNYGNGNVSISGGDIKIVVGLFGIEAYVEGQNCDVTISGGSVNIDALLNTQSVTGIYNSGTTTISGGDVTVKAYGDVDQAISIWAVQGVNINGGNTTLVADTQREDKYVCGIYTPGDINITKGQFVATGKMQALVGNVIIDDKLKAYGSTEMSGDNEQAFVIDNLDTYKYIKVVDAEVEGIEITTSSEKFEANKSYQFTAQVSGFGDVGEVVWSIQGATSQNTTITQNGVLTIGKDEQAKQLVVVAISQKNPTIFVSKTIEITSSSSNWYWYVIGASLIVIILIVVLTIRIIRKKRFYY